MMSAKMATPALLKIKVFWNKGYYVIYSVCDVTNKILSHDSNYIIDVVLWLKFGICIREVVITSILKVFDQKNPLFWGVFKFNSLGLAVGTNLKFYSSLWKELKLKVRKFGGLIPTFVEVVGEKLVGGGGFLLPTRPILNRVKNTNYFFVFTYWKRSFINRIAFILIIVRRNKPSFNITINVFIKIFSYNMNNKAVSICVT